jgi:hypothetical protein
MLPGTAWRWPSYIGSSTMTDKPVEGLHPKEIVRLKNAPKYFRLGKTQLDEKIKAGEIEAPISLSASGRAKGFTGRQILNHQERQSQLSRKS